MIHLFSLILALNAFSFEMLPPARRTITMTHSSMGGTIDNWAKETMSFFRRSNRHCSDYKVLSKNMFGAEKVSFVTERLPISNSCEVALATLRSYGVQHDFYISLNEKISDLATSHIIIDLDFPEYRGFDKPAFATIYYCK